MQLVLLAGVPGVLTDEQGLGQPVEGGGLGCIHLHWDESLAGWWGWLGEMEGDSGWVDIYDGDCRMDPETHVKKPEDKT